MKKEDRENKLSERAYRAIFAGWDKEILGAARLIPFEVLADGEIVLYITKVTKTFKVFDAWQLPTEINVQRPVSSVRMRMG